VGSVDEKLAAPSLGALRRDPRARPRQAGGVGCAAYGLRAIVRLPTHPVSVPGISAGTPAATKQMVRRQQPSAQMRMPADQVGTSEASNSQNVTGRLDRVHGSWTIPSAPRNMRSDVHEATSADTPRSPAHEPWRNSCVSIPAADSVWWQYLLVLACDTVADVCGWGGGGLEGRSGRCSRRGRGRDAGTGGAPARDSGCGSAL